MSSSRGLGDYGSPRNSGNVGGEKSTYSVTYINGDESFKQAMLAEPPKKFSRSSIILYLTCMVAFFASTSNGFDTSLFNSLLENSVFKTYFKVENVGLWTGIVASIYQIGGVVAIPFIGPFNDIWGRRAALTIGACIIILGTAVQGTTNNTRGITQFMVGRFFLGFGVAIASTAGPMYVTEVSHPAHRGVMTGLYNTFWLVGSITAAGTSRGSLFLKDNRSWLVPVWTQMVFAILIVSLVWIMPESPRWLFVNKRQQAAKEMLTKYHGEGNPESPWVTLQLREYQEYLVHDGSDKRWWDYSALFATRASRYRLFCNITVVVFGQWAGNSVLSYFLGGVLDTAGFRSSVSQLNINLVKDCLGLAVAVLGALCVEKFGRRPLLIGTNLACSMVWVGMVVATSRYAASIPVGSTDKVGTDTAAAWASLAMIFLFAFVFAFGFTPLQTLYPVEVLSFELRAKGMGFSNFAVNAASLVNQFALPVSLQKIQWRTYIIFAGWCLIQATVVYFFIPETKNRTLEELDDIFNDKNPRKKSLEKRNDVFKDEAVNYQ